MKKRIVCFGDSNTWGYNAETKDRFDDDTRWTRVLAKELGQGYKGMLIWEFGIA